MYLIEIDLIPLVFDRIMQQRGDGLILITARSQDQTRDRKRVADVGNAAALAILTGMQTRGQHEGLFKTGG
jgi:hypothetical protein